MSSSVRTRLHGDLTGALKASDAVALRTLRMVEAALKNDELAQREELSDAHVVSVLQKEVKRRREAADLYRAGGRDDRAAAEDAEAAVIGKYLPAQLADTELEDLVREALASLAHPAQGVQDTAVIGKVMGAVMGKVRGRADGSRVRDAVQRLMSTARASSSQKQAP